MRLFHIADLHLGKTLHGWDLLEDQAFILDGVVAKIGAMRPDVLLVAGDVYDRAIPPVEAIRLFDDFLGKARRAGAGAPDRRSARQPRFGRQAFVRRLVAGRFGAAYR